jgi:hypothetical protein
MPRGKLALHVSKNGLEAERSRKESLFLAKGVDISQFLEAGISFGRPRYDDLGIYRLIVEVRHFCKGVWCACAWFNGCSCKRFPESRLSLETVIYEMQEKRRGMDEETQQKRE